MDRSSLDDVDSVVELGYCVISAERSTILALVEAAIDSGRSATFYMPKDQARAVNERYWTPQRRQDMQVVEVRQDERDRIERELGVKDSEFLYSNRIDCTNCGHVYGAFEFVQQGIREHGKEAVETALKLANAAIIRVNPYNIAVCPECGQPIMIETGKERRPAEHYYEHRQYGCCVNPLVQPPPT